MDSRLPPWHSHLQESLSICLESSASRCTKSCASDAAFKSLYEILRGWSAFVRVLYLQWTGSGSLLSFLKFVRASFVLRLTSQFWCTWICSCCMGARLHLGSLVFDDTSALKPVCLLLEKRGEETEHLRSGCYCSSAQKISQRSHRQPFQGGFWLWKFEIPSTSLRSYFLNSNHYLIPSGAWPANFVLSSRWVYSTTTSNFIATISKTVGINPRFLGPSDTSTVWIPTAGQKSHPTYL